MPRGSFPSPAHALLQCHLDQLQGPPLEAFRPHQVFPGERFRRVQPLNKAVVICPYLHYCPMLGPVPHLIGNLALTLLGAGHRLNQCWPALLSLESPGSFWSENLPASFSSFLSFSPLPPFCLLWPSRPLPPSAAYFSCAFSLQTVLPSPEPCRDRLGLLAVSHSFLGI